MKQRIKKLSLLSILLVQFSVVCSFAQTGSTSEQNAMLREINKALAEQNQVLAEQNQALAEQVDAYDKRVSALEEAIARPQGGIGNTGSRQALPLWVVWLLVVAILFSLLSFIYIRARVRSLRKRMEDCETDCKRLQNDRQRIDRVREELERKISAKEHDLRSEVSAMSLAITAVRDAAEEKYSTKSDGQNETMDGTDTFVEDEESGSEEEVKPKISGDECFKSLSTIFIRNEQRLVAVEGGVSITTANKWLDAWERNGWIEKVSRGKYMKTLKGKKISLNV